MSKIKQNIERANKHEKRHKLITTVLTVIIVAFVILTGLQYMQIKDARDHALKQRDSIQKISDTLEKTLTALQESKTKLEAQNKTLLARRGNINRAWEQAENSNRPEPYVEYLEMAIETDANFNDALGRIDGLLDRKGFAQLRDPDTDTPYFNKIENLRTENLFLRAAQDRSIRAGEFGSATFDSRLGVIRRGEVVKVTRIVDEDSVWAEIRWLKRN